MDDSQTNSYHPIRETTLFFRRSQERKMVLRDLLRKFPRLVPLAICGLIILCHITFLTPQRLERAENFFFDLFFRIRPNLNITENITYIEIAEDGLQVFGRWPWPRQLHAVMLHILTQWQAKMVIFDIVFSEPSTPLDDGAFTEALQKASDSPTKVYLPLFLENVGTERQVIHSLPQFEQYAKAIGHIQITPDKDGLMRRIQPFLSYKNETYPHLGLTVAFDLLKKKGETAQPSYLPLDHEGNLIINWVGKWKETFTHYSFLDVVRSFEAIQKGKKPIIDPQQFKNKICIIGVTATGLTDIKPNPIESSYPAAGLYGNIINNVLNRQFLQPVSNKINALILISLGLIATFFFLPFRHLMSFLKGLFLAGAWTTASFVLFWKAGIWLYMFQHLSLIFILFLFCAMYSFFFVEKEKKAFFEMATHDGLTGLLTIRHFRQLLNETIREAKRKNETTALILMDIDNFKKCNDTYGHQMGDEVLKTVAQIVNSCNQAPAANQNNDQCIAARYGGEEMVVLIRQLKGVEQAVQYAEWIRQEVEKTKIIFGETTISVTLSLGIAAGSKDILPDKMVRRADEALYQAKNSGKNRVCVAQNSLSTEK